MKRYLLASLLILSIVGLMAYRAYAAPVTVSVDAWGGGAGGILGSSGAGHSGGGAGAYAGLSAFSITSGQAYSVVVGTGSAGGSALNGATTTFNTSSLIAAPGWHGFGALPGLGGAIASSTGDILHAGGRSGTASTAGSGGGGAGGTTTDGSVGSDAVSGTEGAGGNGGAAGGGNGGKGSCLTAAANGSVPGGGGGGGGAGIPCNDASVGAGANGEVIIKSLLSQNVTATGGTHTTDATYDIWTFTSSGTWTPTFSGVSGTPQVQIRSGTMTVRSGQLIIK